jgi:hypothetical protein
MMSLATLTIDDLAQQCADNTEKFFRRIVYEADYCFELLRRALADMQADAFTRVYQIYFPQVQRWIYRHPRFPETNEPADYFANIALSSFYFALRGEKFSRFAQLSDVLAYLKACVHTAISQYLRRTEALIINELTDSDVNVDPPLDSNLDAARIWARICELLPDASDRLLADCAFRQDLKPAEIARVYAQLWPQPRDVSVALQRIRRNLRSDETLRAWFDL